MGRRRLLPFAASVALAGLAWPTSSVADTLHARASARDGDYIPVEELGYELLLEPRSELDTTVALRLTLHNASESTQDAFSTLALPRGSRLTSFAVKRDGGGWEDAIVARDRNIQGQRTNGSIYARQLPPASDGQLPRAEVAAFALLPDATVQIELRLEVFPVLVGDRWELDFPRRNIGGPHMSPERRVVVPNLAKGQEFWVDDVSNGDARFMTTRANDTVTVAWPARIRGGESIEGRFEVMPASGGPGGGAATDEGDLRVALRLGASSMPTPEHVVLVVDRSRSTEAHVQRAAARVFTGLLDKLPAKTTFEVITFDRKAELILGGDGSNVGGDDSASGADSDEAKATAGKSASKPAAKSASKAKSKPLRAGDDAARRRVIRALDRVPRGQGSDLRGALQLATERVALRNARRSLVMVVTDGAVPSSVDPAQIATAVGDGLGKARRPEFLFVIDDPLSARTGLPTDSPIARLAAELGARIRLESLTSLERADLGSLLDAPPVLGRLELDLPPNVVIEQELPEGLVAGHVLILDGHYVGKAPSRLGIKGIMGGRRVNERIAAKSREQLPEAFVVPSILADPDTAAAEGFATPGWFNRALGRESDLSVAQASYDGVIRKGHIDGEIVRRYMQMRVFPRASVCYNRELARNQVLEGRVSFDIEMGKGEVMYAGIGEQKFNYGVSKDFVDCLTEAVWALEIPAGKLDTEVYRVRYPLRFTPPRGGKAPKAGDDPDPMFQMLMERADTLSGKSARSDDDGASTETQDDGPKDDERAAKSSETASPGER